MSIITVIFVLFESEALVLSVSLPFVTTATPSCKLSTDFSRLLFELDLLKLLLIRSTSFVPAKIIGRFAG